MPGWPGQRAGGERKGNLDRMNVLGRYRSLIYRARFAIALFALTLLTGVFGHMIILHISVIDALYFTVVTLATVGYGDIVPRTPSAQLFTTCFILGGMLTALYSSTVVIGSIVEGEVQGIWRLRRELKRISKMENHIIICGFGRIGRDLAQSFARERAPFVVIESDETGVSEGTQLGYTMMRGDATADVTLMDAGIERARTILPVLASDADNLFIAISARQINPKVNIIARATDEAAELKMKRVGADQVIRPLHLGAQHLAQAVLRPAVLDFMFLTGRSKDEKYAMEEIAVLADSELANQSLGAIGRTLLSGIIVVGIKRAEGELVFNPRGDTTIRVGDRLVAMGGASDMDRLSVHASKQVI